MASALDLKYDYLVEHSRPVCILKMLLETPSGATCGPSATLSVGIGNHLSLARLWVTASRISSHEVIHLVREELTEAARTAHADTSVLGGSEPSNGMVVSLLRCQSKFSSFSFNSSSSFNNFRKIQPFGDSVLGSHTRIGSGAAGSVSGTRTGWPAGRCYGRRAAHLRPLQFHIGVRRGEHRRHFESRASSHRPAPSGQTVAAHHPPPHRNPAM